MRVQPLLPWLTGLLIVQVLLAVWLWRGDTQPALPAGSLLGFDGAAVDGIEISDGERALKLVRTGEGWVLPALFDFPAAGFRVDGLLAELAVLKPGLAVATSAAAAKRFRVADEGFERRVRLLAGDAVAAELYVGDAAGPRRAYGRVGGETAIYPLAFTTFQAAVNVDDWTDKTLLHRDPATIAGITLGDIHLERDGDAWLLADLAEGETTDADAAAGLVSRLANLDFAGVHGPAKLPQGKLLLSVALTLSDGTQVDYRFVDPGQQGDPLLEVSDRDFVLRIASYVFQSIGEVTRDKLVKPTTPKAEVPVAADDGPSSPE